MYRGRRRQGDRARGFAYFASLPPQRAGALLLAMWVNALVSLLVRGLLVLKLGRLAARVRARRANGERLLSADDASTSSRLLLTVALGHEVARRVAAAVLRRNADRAIRDGTADLSRAEAILTDPQARKKTVGELYGTGQGTPTA
jgi:hypothetical protein